MKKIFFLLIFFSDLVVLSQVNYHFDYYSIYENKKDSIDKSPVKEMYFSNSKDTSYLLSIKILNDTISSAELIDFSNQKLLIFKNEFINNKINNVNIFKSFSSFNYNLDNCKNSKKNFYEIYYDTILNNKKRITINRYSKKSKKLINQFFYETIPTKITKNQHFNFGVLATPLWCNKFVLNNNELICYSYFIINGKKEYIRELLEINTVDINFNITTNNNFYNLINEKIYKYRK